MRVAHRLAGGAAPIQLGDCCEDGSQLRPDVVWFGEEVENLELARQHLVSAAKVLVVGTSLAVFPAANLLKKARWHAEKLLVALEVENRPAGFRFLRGKAGTLVPHLVNRWLEQADSREPGPFYEEGAFNEH